MKKLVSLLLAAIMILLLSACAGENTVMESSVPTASSKPVESSNSTESSKPVESINPENCNHKWVEATCTVPKTCSVCKTTEGAASAHSWQAATCTAPKTCSVCKTTEGEKLEHNWSEATCTAPKTCSVCKITEGAASAHSWQAATCTAPKTCSVCKETEGEVSEHKNVNGVCSICGKKSYELCEIGKKYKTPSGLDITLNSFTKTEAEGYHEYTISYTLENSVPNTEIGEATFRAYLDDGSVEHQYGFFGNLFYGETITREYSWKVLKNKNISVLEYYGIDSSADIDTYAKYSLGDQVEPDALHWSYEG